MMSREGIIWSWEFSAAGGGFKISISRTSHASCNGGHAVQCMQAACQSISYEGQDDLPALELPELGCGQQGTQRSLAAGPQQSLCITTRQAL